MKVSTMTVVQQGGDTPEDDDEQDENEAESAATRRLNRIRDIPDGIRERPRINDALEGVDPDTPLSDLDEIGPDEPEDDEDDESRLAVWGSALLGGMVTAIMAGLAVLAAAAVIAAAVYVTLRLYGYFVGFEYDHDLESDNAEIDLEDAR